METMDRCQVKEGMVMADMIDIKDELTKLMGSFDEANTEWDTKKNEVDAAYRKMSDTVKTIATMISPGKELKWRGQQLTIVCRPFKDGSGESYFFRGLAKKNSKMIEIG